MTVVVFLFSEISFQPELAKDIILRHSDRFSRLKRRNPYMFLHFLSTDNRLPKIVKVLSVPSSKFTYSKGVPEFDDLGIGLDSRQLKKKDE